jgi:hypothetical protein
MFAIALHDQRQRRALLVRDRSGSSRSSWHAGAPPRLRLGDQEPPGSGLVPRALDLDALAELLAWEYVPSPGRCSRRAQAGAGHLLSIDLAPAT